jgi:hypothetical protein
VAQVVDAIRALKELAGRRRLLMVADSKLFSYPNLSALLASGADFIAPVPAAKVKDEVFAALDAGQAAAVDYCPEREAGLPEAQRGTYCLRPGALGCCESLTAMPWWKASRCSSRAAGAISLISPERTCRAWVFRPARAQRQAQSHPW